VVTIINIIIQTRHPFLTKNTQALLPKTIQQLLRESPPKIPNLTIVGRGG
jgi:hypothetical protein